jgi:hypothetical protein
MTRVDNVVSPPVLGAARRQSFMWPAFQRNNSASFGVTTDASSRQTDMGGANGFVLLTNGAPPAGSGGQVYKGRATLALTSNTNTGYTVTGGHTFIGTQRSAGNVQVLGNVDFAVWELSAILAFDAISGPINANGQIGLQYGSGNWTQPMFGTAPTQSGWTFGPVDNGVIGVRVRTTDGGAVTNVAVSAAPNLLEFHRYAIRVVSASGLNEAFARFLVDGQSVLTIPWGAGTILPSQINTFVAPRVGFTPGFSNVNYAAATNRMYIAQNSVQIIAAPSEDALP